jgi:hypothetical protein
VPGGGGAIGGAGDQPSGCTGDQPSGCAGDPSPGCQRASTGAVPGATGAAHRGQRRAPGGISLAQIEQSGILPG